MIGWTAEQWLVSEERLGAGGVGREAPGLKWAQQDTHMHTPSQHIYIHPISTFAFGCHHHQAAQDSQVTEATAVVWWDGGRGCPWDHIWESPTAVPIPNNAPQRQWQPMACHLGMGWGGAHSGEMCVTKLIPKSAGTFMMGDSPIPGMS